MKVLVIGVGYWGPNIVRNLVDCEDVEKIGISDLSEEKVQKLIKKFPTLQAEKPAPDCFFKDYDGVFIVTPLSTHFDLAKKALEQGLHVFIEKPLTESISQAKELIQLAEKGSRCLMVGHVFHYKPVIRTLSKIVRSGDLGNICYIDSTRVNLGLFRPDTNVLWDLAPHDLSIFESILGRAPKRVSAVGANHVRHRHPLFSRETMMHLSLDYGDDCIGHIHVNWFSPVKQRQMIIAGDKKMAIYDDIHPSEPLRIYDHGTYETSEDTPLYPTIRTGDVSIPQIKQEEPLKIQLRDFLDSCKNSRRPEMDGYAALRTISVLEAAMKSFRSDGAYIDVFHE